MSEITCPYGMMPLNICYILKPIKPSYQKDNYYTWVRIKCLNILYHIVNVHIHHSISTMSSVRSLCLALACSLSVTTGTELY